MDVVSIIIPTLNRHASLRRALASARAQAAPTDARVRIVVVDNSAQANARALVAASAEGAGWPVAYVSEPRPGVANARNAGLRAAGGRWIAFLDDDEEAAPDWLARLLAVARESGADAVFGPVEARADESGDIGGLAPYFSRSLARADGADITDLAAYLGTNNSLFDRARCLAAAEPFDVSLNESGGEDSLLLKRLVMQGRRFAFAAEARVVEWAPPRRLTWAYVRKRKFLSGQIRVFVHRMVGPAQWGRILLWMAVGLAQVVGGGIAALLLWPVDRERAARASATAFGGLGKLLWAPRFRPALYGSGLVS